MANDHPPSVRGGPSATGRALRLLVAGLATVAGASASGQDIEREPIHYGAATPRNAVERLRVRLDSGAATLGFEPEHGYLRTLLRELDVPESSQVLVFSKTSSQRDRISPETPRAIYFNDEVMVGFCRRGGVIELSAADEAIGTAFYTLDQSRDEPPGPVRQTESCLLCHSSSANQGIPGHLVRSLFVDKRGNPLLASRSYRTDHTSPLAERWGGWYVTGTGGRQMHLGNLIARSSARPEAADNKQGVNVVDLSGRFETAPYLTPHSDIVALMVLEHQVGMLNRLARASIETRLALHYEQEMDKALGRPAEARSDGARSRIRRVGDEVVRYLLFADEAPLTDRIEGTSTFASDFAARGPRDAKGRSLRDLDLRTRLFRYPCGYLIYSRAFDSLPAEVKDHVYRRLLEVLEGHGAGKDDPRLAVADREAILEILRETKPDLPDDWKAAPRASAAR
jgi:hypothetical protein